MYGVRAGESYTLRAVAYFRAILCHSHNSEDTCILSRLQKMAAAYPNGDPRAAKGGDGSSGNTERSIELPERPAGKKSLILNAFVESCIFLIQSLC